MDRPTLSPSARADGPGPAAGGQPPGAVRAGALLATAMAVSVGATYLFYLVSGRLLGPADYGTLATVLALVTIVGLPFTALQLALSREVSTFVTRGEPAAATRLSRSLVRVGVLATAILVAVFLALMVPLEQLLNLDSLGPLAFAAIVSASAILLPLFLGDLQGRQEYGRLAAGTALQATLRFALFLVLAAAGWRLYGALGAMAIAALVSVVVPAWWRREVIVGSFRDRAPVKPFLLGLVPVLVAILGVTALTNVDLLFVKARLTSDDAGIYAAAGAFAKVAFFLPAAMIGVLFPRVAARRARGEDTEDILGRTLVVTIGFCAVLFTFYGLAGTALVRVTYGDEFAEAGSLLGLFGIGMTFFSLANVLASYHLSRHDARFSWLVAGAAAAQAVALALVPAGLETFLWVNAGVGIALVLAHELVLGSSLPAIRAGLAHVRAELEPGRRVREAPGRAAAWLTARRLGFAEAGIVLVAYTAFAVAITWPLMSELGSSTLGAGGDVFGTIADFWRQATSTGYHVTGTSAITNTGAPFGWEQGNGVNIQSSLAYFPAYLVSEWWGEIQGYNLAAFMGLALSGAAMYWLLRKLTGSILVSAWGGMVFVVFPWHLAKAEAHASLAHLEGFPLLALALLAWYRRPRVASLGWIALAMLVIWLTSGYYGVIALVALVVLLPLTAWFHRRRLGGGGAIGRMTLAALAALLPSVLVYGIASLGAVGGEIAPERKVEDLAYFGARVWEFVVPSADTLAFGRWTTPWLTERTHLSNFTETSVYVGWLTIVLGLGWLVWAFVRRRRISEERRWLALALSSMVVVALLLMPPYPISLGGLEIPTLPWVLWKLVPQFRVPTRFMALLMLGFVPLAALGLAQLRAWFEGRVPRVDLRRFAGAALVAVVAGISFVELSTMPSPALVPIGVPPEYQILAQAPPGNLVEYPYGAAGESVNSDYTFWQRYHGRPLVNGAPAGTLPEAARGSLADPSQPGVAANLATLGVTAVVSRAGEYPFPGGAMNVPRELGEGYELVGRSPSGTSVWAVTAEPRPLAIFMEGFSYTERPRGRQLSRWLAAPSGVVEIVALEPGPYLLRFVAQSYLEPRRLVFEGDGSSWAVEVGAQPQEVYVPVDLPRGRSQLVLRPEPGPSPAPAPDTREVAVYMTNWVFDPSDEPFDSPVRPVLLTPVPYPGAPS